jgi:hypothetical protein
MDRQFDECDSMSHVVLLPVTTCRCMMALPSSTTTLVVLRASSSQQVSTLGQLLIISTVGAGAAVQCWHVGCGLRLGSRACPCTPVLANRQTGRHPE